jgi:hypothetical protein
VEDLAVTVLLKHELPDGSSHFDWLLERAGHPDLGLVTFRVQVRPDENTASHFEAVRLADHRREYLTYEGPISGGRGRVIRLASGACAMDETPGRLSIRFRFGSQWREVEGKTLDADRWEFRDIRR